MNCEASIEYGRQVGRWQLDSKTEKSLQCFLAKATWRIKRNSNYNRSNYFLSLSCPSVSLLISVVPFFFNFKTMVSRKIDFATRERF